MIEMIRQIPGPLFLLLYSVVVVLGIVVGRKWIDADGSEGHSLPDFTRYDPVSLALLRGGINEVIRTVVFMLTEQKLVEIKTEGNKAVLKARGQGTLSAVENDICNFIRKQVRYPADLFKSSDLKHGIETHLSAIRQEFTRARLIRTDEERNKARMKKLAVTILVLFLGLTKLYLGITNGRPVAFLVMLLIIATMLLLIFLKVNPFSTLGKQYLTGLQKHFEWIKDAVAHGKHPAGLDPAMAVALFGVGSLVGIGHYQAFASAFPAKSYNSGGCSSAGCGGSSGCGGSGGCGGCGGG